VELAWKEPELVAPAAPALFRLEPPSGARVVDLDAAPEVPGPPPLPLAPLPPGEPAEEAPAAR
jgi:hypothetical protein